MTGACSSSTGLSPSVETACPDASRLKVWPLGGYAPGNYSCRCRDCEAQFDGDKRAMVCLDCAVTGANARLAANGTLIKHMIEVESRLRIALWNELRRSGVTQDTAIQVIRDAADGATPAMTAETVNAPQATAASASKPTFEQLLEGAKVEVGRGRGAVNCTYIMAAQGKPYPRTCQRCRLGPCPFQDSLMSARASAMSTQSAATTGAVAEGDASAAREAGDAHA